MARQAKKSSGLTATVIRAPGKPWRFFFVYHGITFVNIPATGNSWRRRAIKADHQDKAPYIKHDHHRTDTVVAFVRHPVDRFVGVWRSKYHSLDFEQIMDRMLTAKHEDLDGHLMPQHYFLDDLPELYFLGRFEYLFQDWKQFRLREPQFAPLERRLDLIGQPITHLVLDDVQVEVVADFYRTDMDKFGYV